MARTYAIGDIHGCFSRVEALLNRLPVDWATDTVVFLGDYVDRGPESSKVLELMLELQGAYPGHVVCLRGNHEELFQQYLDGKGSPIYLAALGGRATLESYPRRDGVPRVPASHRRFLEGLRLYHETDHWIFVHAGLRPGRPLEEQDPSDMLWIRSEFIGSDYDWGKRVIFGHTPFAVPLVEENKIGIDTGAVYGGRLTALVLPELDFVFQ